MGGEIPETVSKMETYTDVEWRIRVLSKVLLFRTLKADQRKALAEAFTVVEYGPGDVVIAQGSSGNTFYVIGEGSLQVSVTDASAGSGTKVVSEQHVGDFVGEGGLLAEQERVATCTAKGQTVCLELSRDDFVRTVCNGNPEALKHVQRHFDIRKFESSNSGNMLMTLQQNEGLELLRDFARKQFCAEHIGFCEAVDRFHTLPEGERNEGAAKCYAQFINPESVDNVFTTPEQRGAIGDELKMEPREGAVPATTFKCGVDVASLTAFDVVAKCSETTINTDVLPRFIESSSYKDYVNTRFPPVPESSAAATATAAPAVRRKGSTTKGGGDAESQTCCVQ